ncbi:hypothetical protein [Flagellimonas marinaquae]|uniref:hypothetical protein n=1 Tax=Flagellimonas marinaquae TaxID=254955 RepID=UPI00207638FB|nr:hypothetical protein [Allomuricauda aquimarina]USD24643.1 hypothetical protein MJO53_13265 [Allomuricauda aquimarina]
MDNYLIGALGGLIGSILTVVISKGLEIFQKSKEHKYELEKQFFLKKLSAAEAAVMQYSLFSDALSQLMVLYGRYEEYETDVGKQLNENLLNQIDEKIALANNASFSIANAISLYFDLQSDFSKNQIISNFYDTLNSLGPYSDNVEKTFHQYLNYKGTKHEKEAYDIYLNAERFMGAAMKNIADGYHVFDNELQKQIMQIRTEMKKFEY